MTGAAFGLLVMSFWRRFCSGFGSGLFNVDREEVRISYALWLYQQTRVTLSKAAQLAGLDIYEFMSVCKANQVPTMDISPDELAQEIAGLSA